MLPGQKHPEHSHKVKEETFFILHGSMTLNLDDKVLTLQQGDSVLVSPGQWHSFSTETGVIFEEISSTHIAQDSYYKDPAITGTQSRKTFVTYWLE
jgi:N-acetylneuraminate synthase